MAEHLVDSVSELPSSMKRGLAELGDTERDTKKMCMDLSENQKKLLDMMLNASNSDEPIDYEYMVAAKREVDKRRGEVNSKMDAQSKQAQKVYDKIDGAIADLDIKIGALNSMLDAAVGAREAKGAGSKKDKISTEDAEALAESRSRFQQSVEEFDPNEPVYCVCRKVASGLMVGCSNDDCLVAWFHYECVGIPQDTPDEELDGWLCPQCSGEDDDA